MEYGRKINLSEMMMATHEGLEIGLHVFKTKVGLFVQLVVEALK